MPQQKSAFLENEQTLSLILTFELITLKMLSVSRGSGNE